MWLIGGATALSLLGDQALYSALPVFFDDLGLRPVEVGVLLSANRWIRLATNELAHRLTDRSSGAVQRLLLVAALTLGAATTALYATTPGFAVFVAVRFLWGLSWSFIRHLGVLSVMEVERGHRAGWAAGRLGGISRLGSVAGLLGGALLIDWLGFGPALAVLSGVSAVAVPVAWVGFVPIARSDRRGPDERGGSAVAGLFGFAHGMVGPGLVTATLGAVLDEQVTSAGGLSAASLTGGVLAVRYVIESGAAARLGALSDLHGIRAAASWGFALGAGALTIAVLAPWPVLQVGAVVAFFLSGTMLGASLIGFAGQQGSRSLARYATASDLGSACGPLLGWTALALFDERTLGLALGALVYGIAAQVARRLLPRSATGLDGQA